MLKVLVVTNMYPGRNQKSLYGGIFVKEQIESLERAKTCIVDTICIDGHKSKFNYISSAFGILNSIHKNNYDIIHIHYGLSGLFLLLRPFKKWTNVVLTLHGGDILSAQKKHVQVFLTKLLLRKVSKAIVINQEMELLVRPISKKVKLLPCGVDTNFFNDTYSTKKRNRILFAGSPQRWVKNFDLFERIIEEYKAIYGAVEVVALDGFSRDEIRNLLSDSLALVMTSRSEGSPQVIKEALSCDCAILSSDVGDVKNILEHTPGTFVFSDGDSEQHIAKMLGESIQKARSTPGIRRQQVLNKRLDSESISKSLLTYYKE
ncbi:glycosyltransferase family 4 protein [Pseudomonas gregormendelii]|uniref:Glycosyltransferase family 4 protein n=1 Tax=Pseudomonas gregormendelii TaxID=1628277 RepID=A0ABS3AJ07_9PSED|nr:glycosyltransferase family 4 protein [Pseudomonas gregormendelii]MBN3966975.1 glycosyltransferase family 4 protein [Pseudomonas gregormendelii]